MPEHYLYEDLSDEAQTAAREWYLHNHLYEDHDNYWCEPILEEWKEKLVRRGFVDPKIAYSGFGSQGDGASFTATIGGKRLRFPAALQKKVDDAREAAPVIKRLNDEDHRFIDFHFGFHSTCVERSRGNYVHAQMMDCTIVLERFGDDVPEELQWEITKYFESQEKRLTVEVRKLGDEIYDELQDAWFNYTSDDAIADTLTALGWLFTEDGELAEDDSPKDLKLAA